MDEEQVECGALVNLNPFRAQDKSLVRKACYGYYDAPAHVAHARYAHTASVLLKADDMEDLSLAEMRCYSTSGILPSRVRLRRRFPTVPAGAAGQIVAVDFHYKIFCDPDDTAESILSKLGEKNWNVNPILYEVGGDASRDTFGFRSLGVGYMVQKTFYTEALSAVSMTYAASYIEETWSRWCSRTLDMVAADEKNQSKAFRKILEVLRSEPDSNAVIPSAFHGVVHAREALRIIEDNRPRDEGDENALRCTHFIIVQVNRSPLPVPPKRPEAPAEIPLPTGTVKLPRGVLPAFAKDGSTIPNDLAEIVAEVETEMRENEVLAEGIQVEQEIRSDEKGNETSNDDLPFKHDAGTHHYMLAWRYDPLEERLTQGRRNLPVFPNGTKSPVRRAYESAQAKARARKRTSFGEYDRDWPEETYDSDNEFPILSDVDEEDE